jgi:phosphate transport system substrate-binding protein
MKYPTSSIAALALLVATGTTTFNANAQTAVDKFSMPTTVPAGTKIQIDGSNSMQAVNQGLSEKFKNQFPGTEITLPSTYQGSDAGVKAVESGKADLASIGRELTKAETAQGIAAKAVGRSKIAIIVKDDNPYTGNLTLQDFAKIYRGEVTDWSQLASAKGAKGKIKVIDRPNTSDTRRAFANYPVFQNGKLKTGSNAQQLTEDSTQAVVDKLGQEGIGYAPADQVKNIPGIRAISLHNTQPDDPKYPFSQPLVYAYKNKDGKVAEGAKAFLGYASDPAGQTAVSESIATGVAAGAAAGTAAAPAAGTPTTPAATTTETNSATTPAAGNSTEANRNESATTTTTTSTTASSTATEKGGFPWWLLPFIAAGGLLLWLIGKKKSSETTVAGSSSSYTSTRRSTRGTNTQSAPTNLAPDLQKVWLALHSEPTGFDSIVTRSNLAPETVSNALAQLESMGLVTQLSGRRFQRN